MPQSQQLATAPPSRVHRATRLVRHICREAGTPSLIEDSRVGLVRQGVVAAVQRHDSPAIFDWLMEAFSYQGVSDRIAFGYMQRHGRVRWHDIASALAQARTC